MSEYRIEKVRRSVTLVLRGGTSIGGEVFLQPTARYRPGAQEPDELFNEEDPFVPLATTDDHHVLLAKDHIIQVHYSAGPADTPVSGVSGAAVELVFADGTTCSGELRMETRASRSRLLDFLNEGHQRFLTLYSPGRVCLVNCRQIAQVRQR
ncbi:MAG TPA: hypothetical protein VGM67_03415 [Gemmatimonadaceae bacterium]|jgi:hypothetical protein